MKIALRQLAPPVLRLGYQPGRKGDKGDPGDALPPDEQYRGDWSPITAYQPNNKAKDGPSVYIALLDNLNKQPRFNPAHWQNIGVPFTGGTLTERLVTSPSTVSRAGLNIPLGAGPTSPVVGDIVHFGDGLLLVSTSGAFNFAFENRANSWGAKQTFAAATATAASLRLSPSAATVAAPEIGDIRFNGTQFLVFLDSEPNYWGVCAFVNAAQSWYSEQVFAPSEASGYSIVIPQQNNSPTGGAVKNGGVRHGSDGLYVNRGGTDHKFQTSEAASQPVGSVLQKVYADNATWASASDTQIIPLDDTVPQSTEGAAILSLVVTPKLTSSVVDVEVFVPIFTQAAGSVQAIVAVFRGASCVGATVATLTDGETTPVSLRFRDSPASTSALTYSVRVGPTSAAYIFINGDNASRLLGGASKATVSLTEVRG